MPKQPVVAENGLILPKSAGVGIKVDEAAPDYPWVDWHGFIIPDLDGANRPTLGEFVTGVFEYHYGVGDRLIKRYHVPHDHPGTNIFLHLHWAHNGTAISGSFVTSYAVSYSKGHNQANYSAAIAPSMTVPTPDIATVPQVRHRIDEFQLSSLTPNASQLDTAMLEPDGVILVTMTVATIPTITGGVNEPFIHFADIHAQSMGRGTKNKSPNFNV